MQRLTLSASALVFSVFSFSGYAAPLYPQRAQSLPFVEFVEAGYGQTPADAGYDIDQGRELALLAKQRLQRQQVSKVAIITPEGGAGSVAKLETDAPDALLQKPQPNSYSVDNKVEAGAQAVSAEAGLIDHMDTALYQLNHNVVYRGNVEAGAKFSSGNSDTQDYNAAFDVERESGRWLNQANFSLANEKSEGEQSAEEYRAGAESDYKLSDDDFVFGRVEYVDDRFSGYDFRVKELLGYGRHWIKSDRFNWNSRLGAGYQHTKEEDAKRDDSPLGRVENDISWKISPRLTFENNLQADVSDLSILRTETALKNQLIGNLFLKLGVVTEYLSDVPSDNEKLDVDTTLNLSYAFGG